MSEIEKLYENAGVKPDIEYWCKRFDETSIADCNGIKNSQIECAKCENGYIKNEYYPEFTAEKQLEIVKQILFSKWWLNLKRLQFSEKFDEGLAQMINELWKDLTEEEKAEIKRILE